MTFRDRFSALREKAAALGVIIRPEDCPRDTALRLTAACARVEHRARSDRRLAWLIGQYVRLAVCDPARYPVSPDADDLTDDVASVFESMAKEGKP